MVNFLLSQVPGLVVGIISGLIAGLVSGIWVARILESRERSRQVRKVTADLTTRAPVQQQPNTAVMASGYLTIKNSSDWPVREVIVMEPHWLNKFHLRYLGPGREHVEPIPHDVLMANSSVEALVTLQLTDVRGRVHQWRPATDDLFDPGWIPLHSRSVQWFASHLPLSLQHRFNALMMKLPNGPLIWVWGYHPATGEQRSKNPKGQPLA